MKTYKVTIEATRGSVVRVEAETRLEAMRKAKRIYHDEDHVDVDIDVDSVPRILSVEEVTDADSGSA